MCPRHTIVVSGATMYAIQSNVDKCGREARGSYVVERWFVFQVSSSTVTCTFTHTISHIPGGGGREWDLLTRIESECLHTDWQGDILRSTHLVWCGRKFVVCHLPFGVFLYHVGGHNWFSIEFISEITGEREIYTTSFVYMNNTTIVSDNNKTAL